MGTSTQQITMKKPWGLLHGQISPATRVATVDTLSVKLGFCRQGLGSQLYNEFEAKAKASADTIVLEVFYRNDTAIRFWKSQGFVCIGMLDQGFDEYVKEINLETTLS